jgi:hypothetical protein
VAQQAQDNAAKELQEQRAEADRLIKKIPALIEEAAQKNESTINVLGRHLVGSDVACHNVDTFIVAVGSRPVHAEQLAGTAYIVFEWCNANGLACETKGVKVSFDHEYDLIARPK